MDYSLQDGSWENSLATQITELENLVTEKDNEIDMLKSEVERLNNLLAQV